MFNWLERYEDNSYIFESCANDTSFEEIVEVLRFIDECKFTGNMIGTEVETRFYWDDNVYVRHILVYCSKEKDAAAFKLRLL